VELTDLDPPNGYSIGGEGQGGVAGFAKGGAKVMLTDDGDGTMLRYEVHAQVGGKIAQLGARLIDATAKQMADQFFDRFSARVTAMVPAAAEAPVAPVVAPPPASVSLFDLVPAEIGGFPIAAWIGGAVYGLILLLFFGSLL